MSGSEEDKAMLKLIKDALAESGVKVAESLPIIGPIAGIIKGLIENSKGLYDAINRQKLYDFYMGIYELDDDKEKYITNESLGIIVRKLLQDDEATKTKFYSRFIVNVASSEYNENERTELIIILSKLTSFELQLARKYYINSKYEIDNSGFIVEQLANLSDTSDGFQLKAIENLKANGLVYESKINRTLPYEYNIVTNVLESLVELIYPTDELKPESINASYDIRESVDVFIFSAFHTKVNQISYESSIKKDELMKRERIEKYKKHLFEIKNVLTENNISYKIGDNYSFERYRNGAHIFVYIDGDVDNFFDTRDNMYENKRKKRIVVSMAGSHRLSSIVDYNETNRKYIEYVGAEKNKKDFIEMINNYLKE
ncbi:hypothetical protein [Providencia stuartii]|uniref:hypothetical protein n=1 Tax=Providencia stuartii TaxID=588 RepID=UPI00076AE9C0|nr:hypothetical protein [Providencia stuartii]AMG65728.1 hypothetical protein AL507_03720 [Providencia stuartii]